MRLVPLAAVVLVAGCTDALGIGGECDTEMREVRRDEGLPDEQTPQGLRSVRWIYDSGSGARYYYDFDWSSGSCIVTGPVAFSRALPDEPVHAREEATAIDRP